MLKALATVLAVFVVVAFATANNASIDRNPGLVVHEWGTFTTVAGPDGMPVDWLPLAGPADLPCFVNHYINPVYKYSLSTNPCLTYQQARTRLKGKVRMETPVLYFYSPRQETVNVRVDFPQGLVTEWYPPAAVSQVDVRERSLIDNAVGSSIEWKSVRILPGLQANFPLENRPSHYYAARETDAAPVQVKGKDEKFLFYRGVGSFPVPLKTQVTSNEKIRIEIKNTEVIPALVLFEKRDERIGFRVLRAV
ncbi:MAG: hypothetical protein HY646_17475, partial [Acidobacteria bacterium]|nr:hypothetical protein [Acidobacteriota bacterium]